MVNVFWMWKCRTSWAFRLAQHQAVPFSRKHEWKGQSLWAFMFSNVWECFLKHEGFRAGAVPPIQAWHSCRPRKKREIPQQESHICIVHAALPWINFNHFQFSSSCVNFKEVCQETPKSIPEGQPAIACCKVRFSGDVVWREVCCTATCASHRVDDSGAAHLFGIRHASCRAVVLVLRFSRIFMGFYVIWSHMKFWRKRFGTKNWPRPLRWASRRSLTLEDAVSLLSGQARWFV